MEFFVTLLHPKERRPRMLVYNAMRKGDGVYEYRGYTIVRVTRYRWDIMDKYNKLVARASTMQWAKDEVDNRIQFMNNINTRRYGQE